jgi:hypothetical protein
MCAPVISLSPPACANSRATPSRIINVVDSDERDGRPLALLIDMERVSSIDVS